MILGAQEGSNIAMENNCFIHNAVNGDSLVSFVEEPTGPFQNNFGTKINGLKCSFIAGGPQNCIEFDSAACPLPFEYEELPAEILTSASVTSLSFLLQSATLTLVGMTSAMLWL